MSDESNEGPIIVAYDGSPTAERALREGGRLLSGRRATILVVWKEGLGFETIALPAATMLAWTGGITLAAIILVAGFRALGWHESHVVAWLLPKSTSERIVFVALSICAGLGEEMAFRAFLIPALDVATGSTALAVVVSSAAFGMMHGYQRASGAVRAGALGALLAVPFLVTGSIHPSMAAHAAYDVIAGLLLGDWLVRAPGPNERNSGP